MSAPGTSQSATVFLSCLPKNGMKWPPGRSHVTRRARMDARVVAALRALGVSIRKRDVQIELTDLVDDATRLAARVVTELDPGRDVERSEFVEALRGETRLGRFLGAADLEQLFVATVLARYRYLSDRLDEDLPEEDPANHCHIARAVDAFEKTAWFWSSVEAFFEDDHTRAEEAENGGSESNSESEEPNAAAAPGPDSASASAPDAAAAASASAAAAPSDASYEALAADVDAMVLDDPEEMEWEM